MISYIFKEGEEHHPPKFVDKLLERYKILLRHLVDRPKQVLMTALGVLVLRLLVPLSLEQSSCQLLKRIIYGCV